MKMSQLRNKFAGRPALVLGGGPSLPGDYQCFVGARSSRPILIAVNYHAQAIGIQPHFMVYNDHPQSDPVLFQSVKDFGGLRVSPDPTSDIDFDVYVWTGSYSSNTATWFALWLGCDPVVLCGMDCYQGDVIYPHKYSHHVPVFDYPLDDHLRPWREDGLNLLPHVERVRVMSGPLTGIFPKYEPLPQT